MEILKAASMDGCGLFRTLRTIIIPIILPGIAATSLICFIFSWNELLFVRVLTATVATDGTGDHAQKSTAVITR